MVIAEDGFDGIQNGLDCLFVFIVLFFWPFMGAGILGTAGAAGSANGIRRGIRILGLAGVLHAIGTLGFTGIPDFAFGIHRAVAFFCARIPGLAVVFCLIRGFHGI